MNQFRKIPIIALILFFAITVTFPQAAFALNFPKKGPYAKLSRGVFHAAASPFQVPKEIIQRTSDDGDFGPTYLAPTTGFFKGLATGFFYGARQLTSGVVDVLTFYAPIDNDWGPIVDPATLVPQA